MYKTQEGMSFYDAAAPIVMADSIDMEKVFAASRYDKGDDYYLNCPFNKEEYEAFLPGFDRGGKGGTSLF